MDFDPLEPLFVPPGGRFSVDDATEALSVALADRAKPLLVYIHGRAKGIGEPRKSVQEGIYDELSGYGANLLGFTWDADDGGYDESRPAAAAPAFLRLLEQTAAFYERPANQALPRPTVVTHSMGALVLAELAKDGQLGPGRPVTIANLVLSAAAVKVKRHARWLKDVSIAERIYVTVNPSDRALLFAGFLFKPDMLGRELRAPGVVGGRVTYVDLSRLSVGHRYFVPSRQAGHASLGRFYTDALLGRSVDLAGIADAGRVDDVPVAVLRP